MPCIAKSSTSSTACICFFCCSGHTILAMSSASFSDFTTLSSLMLPACSSASSALSEQPPMICSESVTLAHYFLIIVSRTSHASRFG